MFTILLVDDDDLIRQSLAIGLKSANFDVLLAADGDAGLRILESQTVDVLVTDIVMPHREGIELITWVRREGIRIPIIAITGGYTGAATIGRDDTALFLRTARLLGASRTLAKPFTVAQLVTEIRDCLVERAAPPPLRAAS